MYGKILINGTIKAVTGIHIGGSNTFSPIGAVDSPVVTDVYTSMPIIPGSSIKGKMRTLLARAMTESYELPDIKRDPEQVSRLFGASAPEIINSRLQFADAFVSNAEKFKVTGLTEVKFENTINRLNSIANPRQIERVISGVEFALRITYDIQNPDDIDEDMRNTARAFKLLQLDYLGGHGSRGSGRVALRDISLTAVLFGGDGFDTAGIQKYFNEISDYELLSV